MLEMEEAIRNHRATVLLPNVLDAHRITVRCGSIFDDTLFALKGGIDDNKHVRVRFLGKPITPSKIFLLKGSIGEPAIDQGGPKREFFMILMNAISNNSSLWKDLPTLECCDITLLHCRFITSAVHAMVSLLII